jgi:hypothetical protein
MYGTLRLRKKKLKPELRFVGDPTFFARDIATGARRPSTMSAVLRAATTLALLAATLLFASPAAAATHCRVIDGGTPALGAIDAETRLAWIDRRLADDATRARIWAWAWGLTYSSITVVEASLALQPDLSAADRAQDLVGAGASFIGVMAGVVLPLKIMGDQRWWQKHLARSRGEDVCSLLNTAELLLVRDAESEAFGVGPLVHIGNFAINIAAGLVLGLGYDKWGAFLYTTLVGIAVGEVQAATQPTDAVEDLRLYRAGQLEPGRSTPRLGLAMAPLVFHGGGGASLMLRW